MALTLGPLDSKNLNLILTHLKHTRRINFGKDKEDIYCMVKDENNNIRVPFSFARQLWGIDSLNYTELPRKQIECKIELGFGGRDFQIPIYNKLVEDILANKCSFLSLHCGAGKTILAVKLFSDLGLKTAVLTDGTLIFPQWVNVLKSQTNANVVSVEGKKKLINGKLPDGDIYVMMVDIARKMHPSTLKHIDLLIVDEATYFLTPTRIPAILNFTPSYVLGLCAEVKRDDGCHKFLPHIFGTNPIRKISDSEFIVYRVETKYKPTIKHQYGRRGPDWNTVINSLSTNRKRNDDIIKLCLSLDGKIIIGTKRKSQAKYIHKQLEAAGESTALLIEKAKTFPQCRILVGIYAKMGKGVDTKNLCQEWEGEVFNIAILAMDLCKPEQFVGRIFRHHNPIVYDLVDDNSTLRKHFDGNGKTKGRKHWYLARNAIIKKMLL